MIIFIFAPMVAGLEQASEDFHQGIEIGFARASLYMVHKIQDEQLSGRTAGDIGLNVRTGRLRDSIKSLVTSSAEEVTGMVYNNSAPYWEYHQKGSERLRKRLFLDEDWVISGEKMFASQVELAGMAIS